MAIDLNFIARKKIKTTRVRHPATGTYSSASQPLWLQRSKTMLQQIIPFRYLTPDERESLRTEGEKRVFGPGEILIEQSDSEDDTAYLLLDGSVWLTDHSDPTPFLRRT
ncbi:MAG: hypothetical protein OSA81_04960 [Longimicrobiales bacterium]|nr:hypothetical protein [Longimicrobiales bacterium]